MHHIMNRTFHILVKFYADYVETYFGGYRVTSSLTNYVCILFFSVLITLVICCGDVLIALRMFKAVKLIRSCL